MVNYITPNDENIMSLTDSESIQAAVAEAKKTGLDKVVIPRMNLRTNKPEWIVDKAILLPDDIQIVLDNCYIRQADGCFDNVFRNENLFELPGIKPPLRQQHNIHITGIGNAVIDGGEPNGLSEHTSRKDGFPYIYQNNTILLHNVDNFVIENITIKNQRWWAINLIYATHGKLTNLTFDAKDNIPNQDGIDLRIGCHDIIIENIYGQAGDDLIALSAFKGPDWSVIDSKNSDIYNVIIKNVVGTSRMTLVALRNMDGRQIHDITIDGVYDTSGDGKGLCPYAAVRIGQKGYYQNRPSVIGETKNIYINDVHAVHGEAVMLNITLENSRISGIHCGKNVVSAVTTSTKIDPWAPGGAYLKNVVIENIFDGRENYREIPLLEFVRIDETHGMENVIINNIFSDDYTVVNDFK